MKNHKSEALFIIFLHKLLGKQLVSIRRRCARYRKRGMREPTSRPPNNQYPNYTSSSAHQHTLCSPTYRRITPTKRKEQYRRAVERERERETENIILATPLAHLFISFASQPYNVFPQSISSGKVNELPAAGIDIHRCHQWSVRAAGACRLLEWILLGMLLCARGEGFE
jgi:hypothetical protein